MTQERRIDVQTFLNENPFSRYQWLIFGLCFFIVLLDGFDTAAIGYIAPSLVAEWSVSKRDLAPVLSAALLGLSTGSLLAGPLADRVGRKRVLVVSVLLFAVACLGSSFSQNLSQLTLLRFVTGIGLGAAMPNAVTLMSEYCPDQRRSMLTNAMFSGFPLGAALGGFIAAWIIPDFGWRGVLMLGGCTPLLLVIFLILLLPESVRHMVARAQPMEHIHAVLRRISQRAEEASSFYLTEVKHSVAGNSGLSVVLSRQYGVGSVMLWLAYFMGLVIFYALINWMPILFKEAGVAAHDATMISALFPLGGVGAILFGWLMDRFNGNWVIAVGYVVTALAIFSIGLVSGNVGLLIMVVFIAGAIMNTSQSSLPALAASYYPTQGRATGVAWMQGIGRLGGIAGSFLVAELARRQLSFSTIFAILAIPGLIAALALSVKQFSHPELTADEGNSSEPCN